MTQYISSPYSHSSAAVREVRFRRTREYAAEMLKKGQNVFSPIVYSHQFAVECGLDGPFEQWKAFDFSMLERCDSLLVLMLHGWDASKGVQAEIEYARKLGKPIRYKALTSEQECG